MATQPASITIFEGRDRPALRITKLARDPDGHWCAHVSTGGVTLEVDRRFGSWLATAQLAPNVSRWPLMREVLPWVATELQKRVRKLERREVV